MRSPIHSKTVGIMSVQSEIERKLSQGLNPAYLEVENESDGHNVPAGSESHFKVTVAADAFEGQRLLARHRKVNALLMDELQSTVHALALHTFTPAEWSARGGRVKESPPCMG